MNILLIGAQGGIGSALLTELLADTNVTHIYATSCSIFEHADPRVVPLQLDYADEPSIEAALAQIPNQMLDMMVVATGFLHSNEISPEKALKAITPDVMEQNYLINTMGPALVAKHVLPKLRKDVPCKVGIFSARVGSISDNQLGGWYSYRMSKAAVNMFIKTWSIELARTHPQACVVGLHPGTVDTPLSQPFQGNVPPNKLFAPQQSAQYLLAVMDKCMPSDSGKIFAWDGTKIPY